MIRTLPKPKRVRDTAYLEFIRCQRCLINDNSCHPPVEAHHVIPEGGGKVGSKVDDRRTVPLCQQHHLWIQWRVTQFFYHDIDVEYEIGRLNREYDALHRPVKVEREKKTRVKFVRVFCGACHHEHDLGRLKIASLEEWGEFVYRCPLKNTEERATL